ncbi:MAG TPA: hypothetical protein VNZ01_08920 [Solirubrobacteraceae bacterium]|nr:hypothetical protein [Solirubrobacteraceae bacterium]
MSTLDTYRKLAAGPVLGASTTFRMGTGYLGIWTDRTPRLLTLGLKAWEPGPDAEEAARKFWDELIEATRCSTEAALDELKRGIDDLEAYMEAEQGSSAPVDPPAGTPA